MSGLVPNSPPKSRLRCDGTFDIECANWTRFAVACTYKPNRGSRIHRSIKELTDTLISSGGTWWAHAGGSFDFLAIAEEFRRRGIRCQIFLSGARISRLIGGGIVLCDSYCLIPMSLDIAASIAGETAPELSLDCECGRSCGGYCAIRPNMQSDVLDSYCERDCLVLYRVIQRIIDHAGDHGYSVRGTLGGASWATARDWLGLPDAEIPTAQWRRLRSAYYGGRIFLGRPIASGAGTHWDLRSAYPAALSKTALPVGEPDEFGGKRAGKCLARDIPGIYACTVTVPDMFIPPLPWRCGGRIYYPTGTFTGVWTLPELQAAIERGTRINETIWCVAYDAEHVVFGELMHRWYDVRAKVGRDSALGQWQSLFSKSLTGKLAESPERRMIKMFPKEVKICLGQHPCSREQCTGACGAYEQIDLWGQVWGVPFYRQSPSAHIHWGAYLTAATRLDWLRGAESQGESLVYGDTDSLWTLSRVAPKPHGNGLGEWALKGSFSSWECPAPKAYRYVDGAGAAHLRVAGASGITDEEWFSGRSVRDHGVESFITAAAASRGLFRAKKQRWTLPRRASDAGWYGDRKLDTTRGITYPVSSGEIRKRLQEQRTGKEGMAVTDENP